MRITFTVQATWRGKVLGEKLGGMATCVFQVFSESESACQLEGVTLNAMATSASLPEPHLLQLEAQRKELKIFLRTTYRKAS